MHFLPLILHATLLLYSTFPQLRLNIPRERTSSQLNNGTWRHEQRTTVRKDSAYVLVKACAHVSAQCFHLDNVLMLRISCGDHTTLCAQLPSGKFRDLNRS